MTNKLGITWRQVLDSSICRPGTSISSFLPRVASVEYQYFCWNDRIYRVVYGKELSYEDTGLTIKDLE